MKTRLNYMGGPLQRDRMNKDKLKSLKKALLYSYQAATVQLSDGREFRCLINPNKLSADLDNKIISIPFRDVCLNMNSINQNDDGENATSSLNSNNSVATLLLKDTTKNEEATSNKETFLSDNNNSTEEVDINIKEGDIVYWKETGSHWLVYLRRLEETAYFRADIRRCRYELTLGNGSKYWAYIRGPVEQSILWTQFNNNYMNKLNYTLIMYVAQNEETLEYFHRFKKVMINNQPWEVQAIDSVSSPGIIEISLKETFNNTIETDSSKVLQDLVDRDNIPEQSNVYIHGLNKIYPYEKHTYDIRNHTNGNGEWVISNASRKNLIKIVNMSKESISINVITGKSGSFTLSYQENNVIIATLDITIGSL